MVKGLRLGFAAALTAALVLESLFTFPALAAEEDVYKRQLFIQRDSRAAFA